MILNITSNMGLNEIELFQEKKSVRPTFSAERIYGGTLLAMCSNDFICFYDWAECRLIRRIDVTVKVSTNVALLLEVLLFSCCLFLNNIFLYHVPRVYYYYFFN